MENGTGSVDSLFDFSEDEENNIRLLLKAGDVGQLMFIKVRRKEGPNDVIILANLKEEEGKGALLIPLGRLFRSTENPRDTYDLDTGGVKSVEATVDEVLSKSVDELVHGEN